VERAPRLVGGLVIASLLHFPVASAQVPALVKDLTPGVSGVVVSPARLVPFRGEALVSTQSFGLWRWNGFGSLACVRDTVYVDGAKAHRMADGTLLFSGHDGAPAGRELWRTDGTTEGTRLVKDIFPGAAGSEPFSFAPLADGTVLFLAYTPGAGYQIWRSDGTTDGTYLIRDETSTAGAEGDATYRLDSAGSRVFFVVPDGRLGVADGRVGGTSVTSVKVESGLLTCGEKALFGRFANGVLELWSSDGTEGGTSRLKALGPFDRGPRGGTRLGAVTFFFTGGGESESLWRTDGTAGGTQLVTTFGVSTPPDLEVSTGGLLYFRVWTPAREERLWRSDGTAAGTFEIAKLSKISGLVPTDDPGTPLLILADGRIWSTDGTVAGTRKAPLPGSGIVTSVAVAGSRVFVAPADSGPRLVSYDLGFGSPVSAPTLEYPGSSGEPLGVVGGRVLLPAGTGSSHVYTSDGTAAGTRPLAGRAGGATSVTGRLTRLGDAAFFRGSLPGGYQLIRTDGEIADPAYDESLHLQTEAVLGTAGGRLYFRGSTPDTPSRLWATDPTSAGTRPLGTVLPWGAAAEVGGRLLFVGSEPPWDLAIWESDGSPEGTRRVKGGYVGSGSKAQAAGLGGIGFFNLPTTSSSGELVRSDGTEVGTFTLPGGALPYDLTVSAGRLFFTARSLDGADGGELWTSDGTPSGTHRVKDINPGIAGSEPYSLVDANGVLFFTASDANGFELWRSDGTEAGTYQVKDIAPGAPSSFPRQMCVADGLLYFSADDGVHGRELWVSDGTEAGTRLVADIAEGASSSYPGGLVADGGSLYFSAFDWSVGYELRRLELPSPHRVATSPGRPVTRRPTRP